MSDGHFVDLARYGSSVNRRRTSMAEGDGRHHGSMSRAVLIVRPPIRCAQSFLRPKDPDIEAALALRVSCAEQPPEITDVADAVRHLVPVTPQGGRGRLTPAPAGTIVTIIRTIPGIQTGLIT
jgi:hypothetical protein